MDGRAIAVTVGIMLASTLGFGLLPALHAARTDVQSALRAESRSATPGGRRWSSALVSVQVALAMMLLVGSLLLLGSFARLSRVDTGFDAGNVLTVPLSLPDSRYPEDARPAFFADMLARLTALPGVERASATATNPFRQWGYANDVTPEEQAATAPPSGLLQAGWRSVTPGFFDTLRVPILSGRDVHRTPIAQAPPASSIVSASLAARLWPGQNAVGHRLYWGGVDGDTREVVGVVGDIRDVKLDAPASPMLYLAYGQLPLENMTVLLRTRAGVAGVSGGRCAASSARSTRRCRSPRSVRSTQPRRRDLRAALPDGHARRVRPRRAAARLGRPLRSRRLHGRAADARDRDSRRARRAARSGDAAVLPSRAGAVRRPGAAAGSVLSPGWSPACCGRSCSRPNRAIRACLRWRRCLLMAVTLLASYLPARRAADLDPLEGLTRG